MGILYIVATPIGNLGDITLRALEVLKEVDLVVCEDTRQTLKLLNHYDISKPLVSYFQHSKLSKIEYIFNELNSGKHVALVTDAGTPGISDPGGKLIEELLKLNSPQPSLESREGAPPLILRGGWGALKIIPIPGPNAAIAALSVSGFPADKFVFMGFPPHKKGRNKFFDEVAQAKYTVVFYESTHRILKTLKQLDIFSNPTPARHATLVVAGGQPPLSLRGGEEGLPNRQMRQIVVCRELTKQFESIYRGTADEILKILEGDKNNTRGEFVIVVKA